jgi:hypothetical protein
MKYLIIYSHVPAKDFGKSYKNETTDMLSYGNSKT